MTNDATSWTRLVVCGVDSKHLVVTLGDSRHKFY